MASAKPSILVVDDEMNTREGLGRALRAMHHVVLAESAEAALSALEKEPFDVMLSDVRMPGADGISLLKTVRERYPATSCVLLTAYGSVETAVEAMKAGAVDFLTKPINLDQLDIVIARTLRTRELESENRDLRKRLDERYGLENIIGSSPPMEKLFDVIRQVAPSQATVLIQGASGTGKELVAQAIHHLSSRSSGPFVAVHCAALSPTLLESELFGHEKGAFTNAVSQRKGRFELAQGGTLFLDEISEIDPSVQVKLLRALETRSFERVGGTETIHADIRIVAATNRDLKAYVDEGKFREDLYYRLDVVEIRMPALRERAGDIPMLCDHFVKEFAKTNGRKIDGIEPAAMAALSAYAWPGNVRELRNTIEKTVVLSRGEMIALSDLPENIVAGAPAAAASGASVVRSLKISEDDEKQRILAAIAAANGNRSRAAEMLGVSRRTFYRKLASLGIS